MTTTYTISTLNQLVRHTLESNFADVWVEGEISNLARPSSGHLYFSLKDDNAQVSCALFKGNRYKLRLPMSDISNGLAVRAHARVSLYEPRGNYQLIIDQLEPAGQGALEQAFIQRREALSKEGLFDYHLKQTIPRHPKAIGIITSPSGAALHDALTTLKRRSPHIPIIIYPTLVQGEKAPAQIIAQIDNANRRDECDTLLLIRGGGSLEDLWAFNDSDLVRRIAASKLPIISGVGHETDLTLSDLAADLRAPTPTAAAEQACDASAERQQQFAQRLHRCQQRLQQQWQLQQQQLQHLKQRLSQQSPLRKLHTQIQRSDDLSLRLNQAIKRQIRHAQQSLQPLATRLTPQLLHQQHQRQQQQLHKLSAQLTQSITQQQHQQTQALHHLMQNLHHLSPLNILARGYCVAQADKQLLTDAAQVQPQTRIQLSLAKGKLYCDVVRRRLS